MCIKITSNTSCSHAIFILAAHMYIYHTTICLLHVVQTQAVYLPEWVLGPTLVTVDLSYMNLREVIKYNILI